MWFYIFFANTPVPSTRPAGLRWRWEKCQVSSRRPTGRAWIPWPSAAEGAQPAADPLRLRLKCLPYQLRRQVGSFAAFKPYLDCSTDADAGQLFAGLNGPTVA
jgi:hypothetical protein